MGVTGSTFRRYCLVGRGALMMAGGNTTAIVWIVIEKSYYYRQKRLMGVVQDTCRRNVIKAMQLRFSIEKT